MSTTFRPYLPDQSLLLPPDVREWLPEGHLAHHVSDLVDGLDLTAFYAPYEGDGRRNAPYEPRMMVKVLLYAYATGVFSSRRVARKLEEDVAFRLLAAGNFPQHRTLCEFRRRHLEDFQALFVEVVRLAQELGLARLGKLSIDGTKVRANASKRKAMSYDRMQEEEKRLEGEIAALLEQADAVDAAEDASLGAEVRGDDLPAELRRREERLAAIRAAKARLEAKQRAADDARGRQPGQDRNPKGGPPYKRAYGEPDEKAQSNFTDPESSIMKTSSEGYQQCYNAQVAVDAEHQLVVATDLTANASDQGELPVLLDAVKETFDAQPETVLADAGYCNERDLKDLEKRGVDGYVAPGREGKQAATRDLEAHPATGRMMEKLATPAGRTAYAERKWLSEAPYGWIKHALGFRRFSLRGLAKVRYDVVELQEVTFSGQRSTGLMTTCGLPSFRRVITVRTLAVALLLAELGLPSAIAAAFNEKDLDVVGQSVDQCDGARGVGKDGVPALEWEVGGDQQGAVLVAPTDELEDQVGGACVVGEISELIDDQQHWACVVPQAAFERAGGLLSVEVKQQVGGGGEESGVSGEDGLVGNVLRQHCFPQALRTNEDDVLATGEEIE